MSRSFSEKILCPPMGIKPTTYQNTSWNVLPLSYGKLMMSEVIQIGVISHRNLIAQVQTTTTELWKTHD